MAGANVKNSTALQQFTAQAETIWQTYVAHGPGHVQSTSHTALTAYSADAIAETSESIAASISRIEQLSQQIACTPQGLCFVSGEAGLVPRRDLHAEFAQHLEILQAACGSQDNGSQGNMSR